MSKTRSIIFSYKANYKTTDDKSDISKKFRVIILSTIIKSVRSIWNPIRIQTCMCVYVQGDR